MLTRQRLLYAAARLKALRRPPLIESLFPQQRDCIAHPSKLKAALCTRRAGKSYGAGSLLFDTAFRHEGAIIPYIALTRKSAKTIMWPVLKKIAKKHGIIANFNKSDLEITLAANGAVIMLLGADQENFIDRLRGGAYPLVVVDEAQAFRDHIAELIEDVLGPAMLDYDGTILLLGTPGPIPSGYFFEVTEQGKHGFTTFKWSVYDNPYLPSAREYVERKKKAKGWTDANPTYQREWLGKWVIDLEALVYKYSGENDYDDLPEAVDWSRVLAVDYGFNDHTAFGILAYNSRMPDVYVEHAEGQPGMIPSRIAVRLQQLIELHDPVAIVADTGGLGKSITEEMIQRYSIPMKAAEKRQKLTAISLLNGAFIDKTLHVHSSLKKLKDQYLALTKDDKGLEDPNLPNDLCDVVLYGYRETKAHFFETEDSDLTPVKRAMDPVERKILQSLEEDVSSEKELEWFER